MAEKEENKVSLVGVWMFARCISRDSVVSIADGEGSGESAGESGVNMSFCGSGGDSARSACESRAESRTISIPEMIRG